MWILWSNVFELFLASFVRSRLLLKRTIRPLLKSKPLVLIRYFLRPLCLPQLTSLIVVCGQKPIFPKCLGRILLVSNVWKHFFVFKQKLLMIPRSREIISNFLNLGERA